MSSTFNCCRLNFAEELQRWKGCYSWSSAPHSRLVVLRLGEKPYHSMLQLSC